MPASLVVLTDFYAVSNRALSYAAGLAVPLGAHLLLLHVRHDELLAPADYGDSYHTWRSDQKTSYALRKLAADQPVPTEIKVSEESLAGAVREAGQHQPPLLVVLARPDPAIAPEGLVVSTAMSLLRHAPYPLLLVPAAGWDAVLPRHLLLAVDGQPFRLRPHQDLLRRLLAATQGTFDVVHVIMEETAQHSPAPVLETVSENNLVNSLPERNLHQVYQITAVDGILEEAARQQTDMLVVVARPHSLFGRLFHESVTAQILRESPIPVLVLLAEEPGQPLS